MADDLARDIEESIFSVNVSDADGIGNGEGTHHRSRCDYTRA